MTFVLPDKKKLHIFSNYLQNYHRTCPALYKRRVSGIFFRYAQSQNIGKQNNLKVIYHTYRDVNKL
jgi:hypothetical protein